MPKSSFEFAQCSVHFTRCQLNVKRSTILCVLKCLRLLRSCSYLYDSGSHNQVKINCSWNVRVRNCNARVWRHTIISIDQEILYTTHTGRSVSAACCLYCDCDLPSNVVTMVVSNWCIWTLVRWDYPHWITHTIHTFGGFRRLVAQFVWNVHDPTSVCILF